MIKQCQYQSCVTEIHKTSKQWSRQRFCSDKCRKLEHRKKKSQESRIARRRANLRQNDEILHLVRECRRGGTVQILHGHDICSFVTTMSLVKNRPKGDLHLCHVAPVKGKNRIGLYHHRNFFYAGAHQNKKYGNKSAGGGLSIRKKDLLQKWAVPKDMSTNEILLKIEQYLGGVVDEYIESTSVRKSKKAQLAYKIAGIDHTQGFDELITWCHNDLREEWVRLTNLPMHKVIYRTTESKYITYMNELSRFLSYGVDKPIAMKRLIKTMAIAYVALNKVSESKTYNKDFEHKYGVLVARFRAVSLKKARQWSEFKDLMYDTAFKTLQGESLKSKKFYNLVMGYLDLTVKDALS